MKLAAIEDINSKNMMKMEKCLVSIYGEKYKKYRDLWNSSKSTVSFPAYPIHLNIELNYGCNVKCKSCMYSLPVNERILQPNPEYYISFEKYCDIIDEGVVNGLCSIALNGWNEPLLKNDIVKYINYAKDKGIIEVSLHTNGILLTNEMTEEFINSGLTSIMVSIGALKKETYKKVYQADKLDIVKSNVLNILERRNEKKKVLPLVLVSIMVCKVNISEISEFCEYWQNIADLVRLQDFINPFLSNDIYDETEDKFRIVTDDDEKISDCFQPFERLLIACDGNVHACCSSYGLEYIVGNIYEESILSIWNGNRIRDLREKVNLELGKTTKNCLKCKCSLMSREYLLKHNLHNSFE